MDYLIEEESIVLGKLSCVQNKSKLLETNSLPSRLHVTEPLWSGETNAQLSWDNKYIDSIVRISWFLLNIWQYLETTT